MSIRLDNLILAALVIAPAIATAQASATPAPPPTAPAAAGTETNAVTATSDIEGDPVFKKFTDILERSPFVPSGSMSGGLSSAEGAAFAGALKLTGFFVRAGVVQVSLEDKNEPEKKYFLKAGATIPRRGSRPARIRDRSRRRADDGRPGEAGHAGGGRASATAPATAHATAIGRQAGQWWRR